MKPATTTYEITKTEEGQPMVQEIRTGRKGKRTILRQWFGTQAEMETLHAQASPMDQERKQGNPTMKTLITLILCGLPLLANGQTLNFSFMTEAIPASVPGATATPGISILTFVTTDAPQARVCLLYHTVDAQGVRTDRSGCQTVTSNPTPQYNYNAVSRIWLTSDQTTTSAVDQVTVSTVAADGSGTTRTVTNPMAMVQY